jgi:hypothetical protein
MKSYTYAERAKQWDTFGCAFTEDAVNAAAACPACINQHCPALLEDKPTPRPRIIKRFNPASDSQTAPEQQADGEKGDDTGG